jgi:glycosyltransferase involved in cell wall biosynthesis
MKITLVHDYLNQFGGAEKVVEAFCQLFPSSPLFTSIYDPTKMSGIINQQNITCSFMQKLPFWKRHFKKYLPLFPLAIEQFDLSEFAVVLSSSSAWAKGVITGPETCHICYCHTPMRFVWRFHDYIKSEKMSWIYSIFLPMVLNRLRLWDYTNSQQVDYFIANSNVVKKRIQKFYGRDSVVIYPPVSTSRFSVGDAIEDYFLVVSRLNAYKRVELPIQAANDIGFRLKIAGEGPVRGQLEKIAKKNVEFLGRVSDADLTYLYSKARALIFPGEEDFGIVPVEAQASGRPVIAFKAGGALETIIDGKTGIFFNEPTVNSLVAAILQFDQMKFDPLAIRENAKQFDVEIFKKKIMNFINQKYDEHRRKINA